MKTTTPTPWDAKATAGDHQHLIWGEDGKTIALVYTDANDAALITRAVNAHAALVEACQTALDNLAASYAASDHLVAMRLRTALELANAP